VSAACKGLSDFGWSEVTLVPAFSSLLVCLFPHSADLRSSEEVSYWFGSSPPSQPVAVSECLGSLLVSSAFSAIFSPGSHHFLGLAIRAVSVCLSELLFVQRSSLSACGSLGIALSPYTADSWSSNEMLDHSSSSPSANPLALSVDLSSLSVQSAFLTVSDKCSQRFSMLGAG